jgi:hypothetical protein
VLLGKISRPSGMPIRLGVALVIFAVLDGGLEHLSPVLSGHMLLHGSHHFDLQAPKKRQGQHRPLRIAAPLL